MTKHQRYLVEQARALARQPDPTGFLETVRHMTCKVNVPHRCRHTSGFPILDPEGGNRLPVACCYSCSTYIDAAFAEDADSAYAHILIKSGRADTYDALRIRGDIGKLTRE